MIRPASDGRFLNKGLSGYISWKIRLIEFRHALFGGLARLEQVGRKPNQMENSAISTRLLFSGGSVIPEELKSQRDWALACAIPIVEL